MTDCQGRFGALVSLALDCCEEFVASAPPHTWLTDVEFGFDHGTLAYSDELPLCRWCRQRHVRKFYPLSSILRRFCTEVQPKIVLLGISLFAGQEPDHHHVHGVCVQEFRQPGREVRSPGLGEEDCVTGGR